MLDLYTSMCTNAAWRDSMDHFIAWLAPIAAGFITLAGQLWLNGRFKAADEKRDAARAETEAKRAAEAEWREKVVKRLDQQDERIDAVLQGQVTQMRSDVTHKIHRYMDDLGCASTEEKNSLDEEYKLYCLLCDKYGIDNDFVANMMEQVMALPSRKGLE